MFKNKDINTNSDFWEISGHQINDNEVNMIAYDILNSNNLSLISKFLNLNNISSIEKIKTMCPDNSAELKGPRRLLRIRPEIFYFEPELV